MLEICCKNKMIPYGLSKKNNIWSFLKYPNKLVLGETVLLFQQCGEQMVDSVCWKLLVNTRSYRIGDIYFKYKVGDKHLSFSVFLYVPTCHMNISRISAPARKVIRKLQSQICCTCASFGRDLVALLRECKSSVISRKKLIYLQIFML